MTALVAVTIKRIFSSLAAVVVLGPSASQAQWTDSVIDTLTNTHTTKYTALQALALDTSGYAHVVWKSASYNPRDFRIWYATNAPGGSWSSPLAISDTDALSPALALSPLSGGPFVAFHKEGVIAESSEIYLAYRDAGIWRQERLTSNTTTDRFSTIGADSAGHLHIAWIAQDTLGTFNITYAYGNAGNWQVQILPRDNPLLAYMAVTSRGVAHIVYRAGLAPEFHVHHTWNDSAGGHAWNDEIVSTGNYADLVSSLAIDDQDGLHLAVGGQHGPDFGTSPMAVYYVHKPFGGTWSPAESVAVNAHTPSIALTASGQPHILWIEMDPYLPVRATGRLFYSRKLGGSWESSEAAGDDYFDPALQIDKLGFAHIAASSGGNTGIYDIFHIRSHDVVASVSSGPVVGFLPDRPLLYQNFPNPFNPTTRIQFRLSRRSFVTLKVFDLLGREVDALIAEELAAGYHEVNWNAVGRPSGVYFYRLLAGSYIETKKLIFMR